MTNAATLELPPDDPVARAILADTGDVSETGPCSFCHHVGRLFVAGPCQERFCCYCAAGQEHALRDVGNWLAEGFTHVSLADSLPHGVAPPVPLRGPTEPGAVSLSAPTTAAVVGRRRNAITLAALKWKGLR